MSSMLEQWRAEVKTNLPELLRGVAASIKEAYPAAQLYCLVPMPEEIHTKNLI